MYISNAIKIVKNKHSLRLKMIETNVKNVFVFYFKIENNILFSPYY